VSSTPSSSHPRRPASREVRCHCSTTGRLIVRLAAMAIAAKPPRADAAAAAMASHGRVAGVPGRSRNLVSPAVAAQPSRAPTGTAASSRSAGSEMPKAAVRTRPYPRSLARATSTARASAASVAIRKSSSHASSSSCKLMRKTGTSSVCQSLVTWAVSCGIGVVTLMLSASSPWSVLSSLAALVSALRSDGRTPAGLSVSSTVPSPCSLGGASLNVAAEANSASQCTPPPLPTVGHGSSKTKSSHWAACQ
jgi:hypothetical protein